MRTGHFLTFAIGLCFAGTQATQAQMPGTYELTICANRCTGSDSALVRGFLVLFRDSVHIDTVAAPSRAQLARDLYLVRRASSVNACFFLNRNQTRVNGQELYAGIVYRSFTSWISDGRTTRVALYASPDASYDLIGTFERDIYSGTGKQDNCCRGANFGTFFRAVRVGDPDLGACRSHLTSRLSSRDDG